MLASRLEALDSASKVGCYEYVTTVKSVERPKLGNLGERDDPRRVRTSNLSRSEIDHPAREVTADSRVCATVKY